MLPGFLPEVRDDLHRQLGERDIQLRLGTGLTAAPATEAGRTATFTVTTTDGAEITADIWFRAHGVRANSDYLADGRLTTRTAQGQVRVTETLTVHGHEHVYALGDITDIAETKMAAHAMQHAEVVVRNITAQLRGERPTATYEPSSTPMVLLPLGPRGGVGQFPTPEGPIAVPAATVSEYKGADMFTARFIEQFGPTAA
ncbi:FAD-dependent oxidoreductase [Micromonospora sp. CPCC 206061]|uniref:FAD-dependent oxidoreductase n=1 Tax=Micromonospora sp. CPCC 206061 TaxID=3122410 RepID=UPI002FEE78FD